MRLISGYVLNTSDVKKKKYIVCHFIILFGKFKYKKSNCLILDSLSLLCLWSKNKCYVKLMNQPTTYVMLCRESYIFIRKRFAFIRES